MRNADTSDDHIFSDEDTLDSSAKDEKTPSIPRRVVRVRKTTNSPTTSTPTVTNTGSTSPPQPPTKETTPTKTTTSTTRSTRTHRTNPKEEKNLAKAVDITIEYLSRPLREQYHGALTNNPEAALAQIIIRFEGIYKNGRLKYDEQWENLTWRSDENFDTFITKFYTLVGHLTSLGSKPPYSQQVIKLVKAACHRLPVVWEWYASSSVSPHDPDAL
jgi:hypothetical protein